MARKLRRRRALLVFFSRKVLFYLLTFYISLSLIWLIPHLLPGDPIGNLIGQITTSAAGGATGGGTGGGAGSLFMRLYNYWVLRFGLNEPLHIQYVIYLKNIMTFSFGPSIFYYPIDSLDIVLTALPWSLGLLVPSIVIGWIVGNYVGAAAAYKKGIYDKILYPFSVVVSNMPFYWFALLVVTLFSGIFRIFPPGGAYSVQLQPALTTKFIFDFLWHYTLPFVALLIPQIGMTSLGMRAMTLYELSSDYMEFSESLGYKRGTLQSYAYKNAILPQFTGLPMMLGSAVAGQVVSEVVFGYPGIGTTLYRAIRQQDYNIIQCAFTIVILVILIGNFLMDILYVYIDPRIRMAYKEE